MDLVVDASIAISWFIVDQKNTAADAILDRLATVSGHVPSLFWHEMRSVLLKSERRRRCDAGEADIFMQHLRGFRLSTASNRSDDTILALARHHKLTAYDAAYLDLALDLSLPLATADRDLAMAALSESVPLLGPLAP